MYDDIKKSFKKDIKNHSINIKNDNKSNRHLVFSNNGDSNQHFEIITWPGYLCISGDMGCYVFSRTNDMFRFFNNTDGVLSINPNYWSEKLQASDKYGDFAKYEPKKFIKYITEEYTRWLDSNEISEKDEGAVELWGNIEDSVLIFAQDGETRAVDAATAFIADCGDYGEFSFMDFWEHNCKDYTYRYIWCLYAIVWGIQEYNRVLIDE